MWTINTVSRERNRNNDLPAAELSVLVWWPLWLPCGSPVAPAFLSPMAIAIAIAIAMTMGDRTIVSRESACRSYGKRKRGRWGKSRPSTQHVGSWADDRWKSMVARKSCKVQLRHMESTWKLLSTKRRSDLVMPRYRPPHFWGQKLSKLGYFLFQGGVLRSPQRDVPSSLWALLRAHLWEICTALARFKV